MKKIILCIFGIAFFLLGHAQSDREEATTSKGEKVILNSDGTWQKDYFSGMQDVEIIKNNFTIIDSSYVEGKYIYQIKVPLYENGRITEWWNIIRANIYQKDLIINESPKYNLYILIDKLSGTMTGYSTNNLVFSKGLNKIK